MVRNDSRIDRLANSCGCPVVALDGPVYMLQRVCLPASQHPWILYLVGTNRQPGRDGDPIPPTLLLRTRAAVIKCDPILQRELGP